MGDTNSLRIPTGCLVNFISWNVKSLNHPVKRKKVLRDLKYLKAHTAFLKETHLRTVDQVRLGGGWIGQTYHSNFARGVAILFKKNIPFHLEKMIADPQGRYIIVSGHINSFPLTLINIYGPNFDCPDFFRKIFGLIPLALNPFFFFFFFFFFP
uniref:Uncharacterized protein n=1 Tax=Pygocentrus nattereri TaxID=42514 RepID=A0AAR2JJG4_PYGNA